MASQRLELLIPRMIQILVVGFTGKRPLTVHRVARPMNGEG